MGRQKYQNDSDEDDGPDFSPEKPAMAGKGKGHAMPHPPFFPAGHAGPSNFPASPLVFNNYFPPANAHNAHNAWAQVQVPQGPQVGGPYYPQPARSMPQKTLVDPYKALEACQLELAKREDDMKELRKLLAALQVDQSNSELRKGKKKGKEEKASSKRSAYEFEKRVGDLARQCSLMQLLFVQPGHFMQNRPVVFPMGGTIKDGRPIALDDPDAFRNADNRGKRTTAVIYDLTPEDLKRDFRKNPKFRESFTRQFNAMRRSSVHKFREELAPKIWKHDADMFAASVDRSDYKPFLKRLYQNPEDDDRAFSTVAPLFFPDKYMQPEDMFKTHELAMVMRGLLFGPTAVRAPHAKPAHGTVGRNWGIKCVTPGLIALAATISVYGHSGDEKLEGKGNKTGINYDHLFNKIMRIILTKLKERVSVATALFKFHNRIVFAGLVISRKQSGAAGANDQSDSDSSGIEDMLGPGDVEAYEAGIKGLVTDVGTDLSDGEADIGPPTPGPQRLEKPGKDYDPTSTSEGNKQRQTKPAKKKRAGRKSKAVEAGEDSESGGDMGRHEEHSGLPPTPPQAGKQRNAVEKSARPRPIPKAIPRKLLADHNDGDDEDDEEYPAVPATPMKKGSRTSYIPKSKPASKPAPKADSHKSAGSDDTQDDSNTNSNADNIYDDSDKNDNGGGSSNVDEDNGDKNNNSSENDNDSDDLRNKREQAKHLKTSKLPSNQRSNAKATAPGKLKGKTLKIVEEAASNEEDNDMEDVAGGSGKHNKAQAVAPMRPTTTDDNDEGVTKKVGKASKSAGSKKTRGGGKKKELEALNEQVEQGALNEQDVLEAPSEKAGGDKKKKKKAGGRNVEPHTQLADSEQPPQVLTIRLPPAKGAKSAQKKAPHLPKRQMQERR